MIMYDTIVERLHMSCAAMQMWLPCVPQYAEKINLLKDAADAIEELQKLNWELLFRVRQAEALIDYYQTGRMISNEPPKEE